MSTTKSKTRMTEVVLEYDLYDLPTAQHKAGLAGMLLLIRFLKQPQLNVPPEQIPQLEITSPTSATVHFTEASLQRLFDDLYDAEIREVRVKSKWAGSKPKRIDEIDEPDAEKGKTKKMKYFVYDVVTPLARFLEQHFPDRDGLWLKLWRDMIWSIPRGRPTTRIPFNQRANNEPCKEAAVVWKDLQAFEKARRKNVLRTSKLSGALLLGSQAFSAESVPFQDRIDHALLLHFWPLVVQIFVPQQVDFDGSTEFVGYALAIPEVADLEDFCEEYPEILHNLETSARGYRPATAVIDIPAQAALEFMRNLAQLVQHKAAGPTTSWANSISGVEYLHLVKKGNNVKSMSAGRVASDVDLMHQYLAIVQPHPPDPSPYRNPVFRTGLLNALLMRVPWYDELADALHERPWPFFIRSNESPRTIPAFSNDAKRHFQSIARDFKSKMEDHTMTTAEAETEKQQGRPSAPLEMLIHRLIRTYVRVMTANRCGKKWDDFKDKKVKDDKTGRERIAVPADYREAQAKVVSDAFLAMRSRREQDFVDYFTSSICRVSQYLQDDEFQIVAEALLNEPQKVKTIAMLSLSANS